MQQGACHADALALTAREVAAGLGNLHVEPAGRVHERRDARALERCHEFGVGGVGLGKQEILAQGSCEKVAVSRYERHRLHE